MIAGGRGLPETRGFQIALRHGSPMSRMPQPTACWLTPGPVTDHQNHLHGRAKSADPDLAEATTLSSTFLRSGKNAARLPIRSADDGPAHFRFRETQLPTPQNTAF